MKKRVFACIVTLTLLAIAGVIACGAIDVNGGDAATQNVAHRAVAKSCSTSRPPGTAFAGAQGCASDTDCDAGVNGRCIGTYVCSTVPDACAANVCTYDTCFSDDACSGFACTCREDFPQGYLNAEDKCAIVGDCRTDSDCPNGQLCSPSFSPGCYPGPAYWCRTPDDECVTDLDCKSSTGACGYDMNKQRWACVLGGCHDA